MTIALLLPFVTGCSSFHRDWRKAAKTEPVEIEGRWEGTWTSDASGHTDKVRCLLTPISENTYEARFHAKYRKILSFGYTATFTGQHTNDVFYFSGDADLGRLAGGIYTYEGRVSPRNFFSTYNSKYDHGTFEMGRPD
ncbi:MAG: hypothetical protein H0X66_05510 [Verrucomicrobia bacterium]|nr:hypothetical protein [Verrucomicrobiota bacterium]